MRIGMIGAGAVALAVARYALQAGHEVMLSNRRGGEALSGAVAALGNGATPGSVVQAASANMVLLAVPWPTIPAALSGLPAWDGRILVDATTPFAQYPPQLALADLGGRGASEIVADLAPGARLVKAFNALEMSTVAAGPRRGDARRVVLVSGDDAEAKGKVKDLIASFGFAAIDLGGLTEGGRMQQAGGPLAGLDLLVADACAGQGGCSMADSAAHVRGSEETPADCRALCDCAPFNRVDATIFAGLEDVLARMDASAGLRVVVFASANPAFYLAHVALPGKTGNITTAVGPCGLPILLATFVRRTTSPVGSSAKIRGCVRGVSSECVRGVSSECVLACDLRVASRAHTRVGQPEVGVGVHPGGGGAQRLPPLVGRGRALAIVLGANDFDGETAERSGYVNRNRALPDAQLDSCVDALARRIASFDRRASAAAQQLINHVSLPSADTLLDALNSFQTALTWPDAQRRIAALFARGLQRDSDFESRWPAVRGTLLQTWSPEP